MSTREYLDISPETCAQLDRFLTAHPHPPATPAPAPEQAGPEKDER